MVRPAVRLRWQRHKNRYGPRDRLVLTKWFPALSILSRNSWAIFWYSSRCCFASHSERGLRLPFKIHTVCITSNSNNCGWTQLFVHIWKPSVLEKCFLEAFAVDTVHIRGQQKKTVTMSVVSRHPIFFQWFVHDLTNNRWLPEFQAQHGVLCGFLRASRRPIRRETKTSEWRVFGLQKWQAFDQPTGMINVASSCITRQETSTHWIYTWTSLNPRLKERENWRNMMKPTDFKMMFCNVATKRTGQNTKTQRLQQCPC